MKCDLQHKIDLVVMIFLLPMENKFVLSMELLCHSLNDRYRLGAHWEAWFPFQLGFLNAEKKTVQKILECHTSPPPPYFISALFSNAVSDIREK